MPILPVPPGPRDPEATARWVGEHLAEVIDQPVTYSEAFRGGQSAADAAEAGFDVTGYARRRSAVSPADTRGASALSPYVRHGLLPLPRLWRHVAGGPAADRTKYRDELRWQEYARHLYARLGARTREPLRAEPAHADQPWPYDDPWPREMACLDAVLDELDTDGWAVNQTRMWLASQYVVRAHGELTDGEDRLYRELLDGSRAANRLGWQWAVGSGTGRPYGFARWQVEKRAPGLCHGCALRRRCPIQQFPDTPAQDRVDAEPLLVHDPAPEQTAGPREPEVSGAPDTVWLTAESLGDDDPALAAHPDLPVLFTYDVELLRRLRLHPRRLVFLGEALADLAQRREVTVAAGDPVEELDRRRVAVTWAPVPGFRRRLARAQAAGSVAAVHPWPWLSRPKPGSLRSYTAWARSAG